MEKLNFWQIKKFFFLFILSIHTCCNAGFTLLTSPSSIIERGQYYEEAGNNTNNIFKTNAILIPDPLEADCFYKIFNDTKKTQNFLKAILYPQTPDINLLLSQYDYYQNKAGKPLVYQCNINNNTAFEVVLSVRDKYESSQMAQYYQRINDRKSASTPIKYITFFTGVTKENSYGQNIGIFSSDLNLSRSSVAKIDNVLDEIIINASQISQNIENDNSIIRIAQSSNTLKKEGLEWLKFLTIAYFQNGIRGKYVIPTNGLSNNLVEAVNCIKDTNPSIEWSYDLFPAEYSLVSEIYDSIVTKDEKDPIQKKIENTLLKEELKIACVDKAKDEIRESISLIDNKICGLNEIEKATTDVKESAKLIDDNIKTISGLTDNIQNVTSQINTIQSLINTISTSLYGVETSTAEGSTPIQKQITVSQQIDAVRSITLGVSETVTKLHSLLSTFPTATLITENQKTLTTEIGKITTSLSSLTDNNLKELNNLLKTISEKVTALSDIMTQLSTTNIATMGININAIKTDIENIKTTLNSLNSVIAAINDQTKNITNIEQKIDSVLQTSSNTLTQIQSTNTTLNAVTESENKILNKIQLVSAKLSSISSGSSGSSGSTDITPIMTLMEENLATKKDLSSSQTELQNTLLSKMDEIMQKISSSGTSSGKTEDEPKEDAKTDSSYTQLKPLLLTLPFKTYDSAYECSDIISKNPQLVFYITARILKLDALIAFGDKYNEACVMTTTNQTNDRIAPIYIRRNRAMVFYKAFATEFHTIFDNMQKILGYPAEQARSIMFARLLSMIVDCSRRETYNIQDTILSEFWVKNITFKDFSNRLDPTTENWSTLNNAIENIKNRSYDNMDTSSLITKKEDVTDENINTLITKFELLLSNSHYLLFYLWAKYITTDIETTEVDTKWQIDKNYTLSEYCTMAYRNCYITIKNSDYTSAQKHVLLNRLYVIKKSYLSSSFANGQLSDYNLETCKRFIALQNSPNNTLENFFQYDSILNLLISNYWTQKYHKDLDSVQN